MSYSKLLNDLFSVSIRVEGNFIFNTSDDNINFQNQDQTKNIFSDKWKEADEYKDIEKLYNFQYDWFLSLYGFENEIALANFLKGKKTIIDTGCGLGYKAAWFAKLAPHATVLGIDISDAAMIAAKNFKQYPNLFFYKGDIAQTNLKEGIMDFTVCDQVIMHTEVPEKTFAHLSSITSKKTLGS